MPHVHVCDECERVVPLTQLVFCATCDMEYCEPCDAHYHDASTPTHPTRAPLHHLRTKRNAPANHQPAFRATTTCTYAHTSSLPMDDTDEAEAPPPRRRPPSSASLPTGSRRAWSTDSVSSAEPYASPARVAIGPDSPTPAPASPPSVLPGRAVIDGVPSPSRSCPLAVPQAANTYFEPVVVQAWEGRTGGDSSPHHLSTHQPNPLGPGVRARSAPTMGPDASRTVRVHAHPSVAARQRAMTRARTASRTVVKGGVASRSAARSQSHLTFLVPSSSLAARSTVPRHHPAPCDPLCAPQLSVGSGRSGSGVASRASGRYDAHHVDVLRVLDASVWQWKQRLNALAEQRDTLQAAIHRLTVRMRDMDKWEWNIQQQPTTAHPPAAHIPTLNHSDTQRNTNTPHARTNTKSEQRQTNDSGGAVSGRSSSVRSAHPTARRLIEQIKHARGTYELCVAGVGAWTARVRTAHQRHAQSEQWHSDIQQLRADKQQLVQRHTTQRQAHTLQQGITQQHTHACTQEQAQLKQQIRTQHTQTQHVRQHMQQIRQQIQQCKHAYHTHARDQ